MILKSLLHDLHLIIAGGSLFLFDRTVLRYFRKDGHNWRKKKHGKTVKEAHEKMKGLWHFSIKFRWEVLTCYIATMPMVKKMKNFRNEAIGCWNRF
ncbi:calmodulin-binding transcription activator 3-like isoform X2 [Arachis ipaensis]|uniref:calmodulin-binding transcription activator 3-like isoform X2 n=1 Tax=Arachis ipaensis TaxID=130454 RepID=UPI000A2B60CE|nr:calmodulin-binding transcription activator 3-like isoform X2 [Arachis ipaensis]